MRQRSPANIVLVEDNEGDVYLLHSALQKRGILYRLTRYENAEQAIAALSQEEVAAPDLILLDLNLPGREGIDVLRAIRGRPALVGVPLGILTSSDDSKDRHRVGLIGVQRYIRKPTTLDEFLDTVGQAVEEMLSTETR